MINKRRFIERITSLVMFTNIFLVQGCFCSSCCFLFPFPLCASLRSALSVRFTAVPLKCLLSLFGFPFLFSFEHAFWGFLLCLVSSLFIFQFKSNPRWNFTTSPPLQLIMTDFYIICSDLFSYNSVCTIELDWHVCLISVFKTSGPNWTSFQQENTTCTL